MIQAASVPEIGAIIKRPDEIPATDDCCGWIIDHDVVNDLLEIAAGATLDICPLRYPMEVSTPEISTFVATCGLCVRVGGQIINEILYKVCGNFRDPSIGRIGPVHMIDGRDGFDGIRPVMRHAIDVRG